MTTTRRTVLRGLAASPTAFALPAVAIPATASSTSPDAILIAKAEKALALALHREVLWSRRCDLESKAQRIGPKYPRREVSPADPDQQTTEERAPDGRLAAIRMTLAGPARRLAEEQIEDRHRATMAAYNSECGRISRRIGLRACLRRQDRLDWRLQNAVEDLRDMTPTTPAGIAIKAQIAVALDPHNDHGCAEWEDDFRAAVLRDAVALVAGGRTDG